MNKRIDKFWGTLLVLGTCGILGGSWTPARGDDLNPPFYRSQPLSVFAHWTPDATGALLLDQFNSVDDSDPSTYLHPIPPSSPVLPDSANVYQFQLPNFVDEMPIKFLRVQLTWTGTTQPPINIFSDALEPGQLVPGITTFASNPLVFTQPDGGYQYFDIEFHPNPDFERVHVHLPPDGQLTQVVIDTVSTVPEPAMAGVMVVGCLAMWGKRKNSRFR